MVNPGKTSNTAIKFALLTCLSIVSAACALPADRYHPQYSTYIQGIRSVLLLTPQITVLQDKPQGKPIWNEQASREATRLAGQAVRKVLLSKNLVVHVADPQLDAHPDVRDVQSLYPAVNRSIQLHTYGPQIFPDKLESFEYGIGSVADLLAQRNAEALVLVTGFQVLSIPQPRDWISIAVAEATGNIIWYHLERDRRHLGMQTEAAVQALVEPALRHFMENHR